MQDGISTRVTLSGEPSEFLNGPAPASLDVSSGMYLDYWILSQGDRERGFIRPVRSTYIHSACQQSTVMARDIAETYACEPTFYTGTFCSNCRKHFPVAEFIWADTNPPEIVGS